VRGDRERLLDIVEAIERIEKHTNSDVVQVAEDELVQIWVLYHLQAIGEAVRSLSASLKNEYPEAPWSEIIGMRNILVHHYFEIDADIVQSAVTNDLPILKTIVQTILSDIDR